MGSLAKQIQELLEDSAPVEELEEFDVDVDEIADWAMEDDDCDDLDEGCKKHKSEDDDEDDDDEEMDEGLDEEKDPYEAIFDKEQWVQDFKAGWKYAEKKKADGSVIAADAYKRARVSKKHGSYWEAGYNAYLGWTRGAYAHKPVQLAKKLGLISDLKKYAKEDVDDGAEDELQEAVFVKAYASMDSTERDMFDELHMMASNEGRFYPNKPKEAVMYAFKEYMKMKSAEMRENFGIIQKHLVRQLQNDWQTVAKAQKRRG